MLSEMKKLISPAYIQQATNGIYDWLRFSIWMALWSLPWTLVNSFITFSTATYLLFAVSFLFVIPNVLVLFEHYADPQELTFQRYSSNWLSKWRSSWPYSLLAIGVVSFFLYDIQLALTFEKLAFLLPFFYLTFMFVSAGLLYLVYLHSSQQGPLLKQLPKAVFLSWRHPARSALLFLLLMLWFSFGYFFQGANLLLGNSFFWLLLFKVMAKQQQKLLALKK